MLVQSLARPGGNITGLSNIILIGKRIELLKELLPNMKRVACLNQKDNPPQNLRVLEEASQRTTISYVLAEHTATDFADAFTLIRRERPDAMTVVLSIGAFQNRHSIVQLAAECNLPAVYPIRGFTDAGGLMSLGLNFEDIARRAASYVDRILKGASPGDLPIEEPSRFDLVVNLRTAKTLGLTIPASILIRATELIE